MTAPKLTKWLLPLTLLCSCVRTVEIPVAVPRAPCPLPTESAVPSLSPGTAGDLVTLTVAEATALGLYLRDEARWHEMAKACLSGVSK